MSYAWTPDEVDRIFEVWHQNPNATRAEIRKELEEFGMRRSENAIRKKVEALRLEYPGQLGKPFASGVVMPPGVAYTPPPGIGAPEPRTFYVEPLAAPAQDPRLDALERQIEDMARKQDTFFELLKRLAAQRAPEGSTAPALIPDTNEERSQSKIIRHRIEVDRPILVAVISDVHVPYHDVRHMAAFLQWAQDARPDVLVINGDFVDAKRLGSFAGAEDADMAEDIRIARSVLHSIRRSMGDDCTIYYNEGNHEDRDQRDPVKAFRNTPGWGWRAWLGLDELGIKYLMGGQILEIGNDSEPLLTAIHGHRIRKWAGSSVRATLVDDGYHNVAIGHVHRVSLFAKRFRDRVVWGVELGGLYDRHHPAMKYMKDPDWQPGFAAFTLDPIRRQSHPHPILIADDGSFAWGGKVYPSGTE